MSSYVTAILNDKAYALLTALGETGLYGDNTAEHLICMGIQKAIADGIIVAPLGPEFSEVEEAAPLTSPFKCDHCDDGNIMPPDVVGTLCPKCHTDCIPF